jgi:hypothetical protein
MRLCSPATLSERNAQRERRLKHVANEAVPGVPLRRHQEGREAVVCVQGLATSDVHRSGLGLADLAARAERSAWLPAFAMLLTIDGSPSMVCREAAHGYRPDLAASVS